MLLHYPEYGIDIIVLVKYQGEYSWYLGNKIYWVLDYKKWNKIFSSPENEENVPERKEVLVLDNDNWPDFKSKISHMAVTRNQLKQMIENNLPIDNWDEKCELFPSLLIDFDEKALYSIFPEYLTFEKYVPDGWLGKYDDFYSLIPEVERYWIINGINHFPKE